MCYYILICGPDIAEKKNRLIGLVLHKITRFDLFIRSITGKIWRKDMARADTQWKPGQSGNPRGRPCGVNKQRQDLVEQMIKFYAPSWEELLEKQKQEALSGNQQAFRLIFEHVLPKQIPIMLTDQGEGINISNLKSSEDRAKAREIAEKACAEIRALGDQDN